MRANKKIRVAAALMMSDGEVFLARRGPGRHLSGFWEFPGGKIEPGEDAAECLKRELFEELSIVTEIGEAIPPYTFRYPETEVEMNCFWTTHASGELTLRDHDQFAWVNPAELGKFKLAPADVPVLGHLFARLKG